MTPSQATRIVRIQQWSQLIQEYHASGMKQADWLRERGLSRHQFYYWQNKVRAAAAEQIETITGKQDGSGSIVEIQLPQITNSSVPAEAPAITESTGSTGKKEEHPAVQSIVFHADHLSFEVPEGVSAEFLRLVLREVRNAQ